MATINSIGLGSSVLTADVIDKLKANDVANIITPIDNKITLQRQKGDALSLLNSLLTTFKSSASALDDDALYQKRSVSGSTTAISVTADAGVAVQSFSLTTNNMALNTIKESGTFASTTGSVATGSGTMSLMVGTTAFNIDYTSATTLDSLKESINNVAGSSVKASTLQVGDGDYRLILTSTLTGKSQTISMSDSSGGTLSTKLLTSNPSDLDGMQEIQAGIDASFKYNGITLERSSNEISDLIVGAKITLLQDTGTTNIAISQDVTAISDEMSNFVLNYNTLTSQLNDMTTSNAETGAVGIFNGDNSINSITREINRLITSVDSKGFSLAQFGVDLNETGVMSFNSSTFTTQFNLDSAASEAFFSGKTTVDSNGNTSTVDGLFTSMNTLMERYTGTNGIISTLTTGSTNELEALDTSKVRSQALLDARYATMTARFVQYDLMMTKLTNQFSSLQQQITTATNGG